MSIKESLSYYKKVLLGEEVWAVKQIKKELIWLGSKYGGFYIVPELLNKESIVYSFGVGEEISFDEDLLDRFSCTVFAFDPTPKSIGFIKNRRLKAGFNFSPIGVHKDDGEMNFYLPKNPDYVSGSLYKEQSLEECISVPVKKFSSIAKQLNHGKVDLIKLDIEGSEYGVIDDILSSEIEIPQILIEVHHRFESIGVDKTKELFRKLNRNNYYIAAISPSHEEYTFIKI